MFIIKKLIMLAVLIIFARAVSYAAVNTDIIDVRCLVGEKCCLISGENKCVDESYTPCVACPDLDGCTAGVTQSKYTASGCSYTTQTRTCCSNGRWSGWDTACSTSSSCSSSTKPSTTTTCYGGTKRRTVRCVSGSWVTGDWGSCLCSEDGFESVSQPDGSTCCQKTDGTGPRCATNQLIGYRWIWQTDGYSCNMVPSYVAGSTAEDACGTCDEKNNGAHCVLRKEHGLATGFDESYENQWNCTLYICKQG